MVNVVVNEKRDQYTLWQIIGIWLVAGLPMWILGWIVAPALSPDIEQNPIGAGAIRVGVLTIGLIWQFVLSLIIVYKEEGNLRWQTIKQRMWLLKPSSPKTGEKRKRYWLWLILLLVLVAVFDIVLSPFVDNVWVSIFPFFSEPSQFDFGAFLESPDIQAKLVGAWWFLALFAISAVFNTFLGEEFLFRGILLPKMEGVFGKWDWVANGILFGLYHLHQPWMILSTIISSVFLLSLPSKRFRSTWMAIITHSGQSIFFLFLILGIVLGLA